MIDSRKLFLNNAMHAFRSRSKETLSGKKNLIQVLNNILETLIYAIKLLKRQ